MKVFRIGVLAVAVVLASSSGTYTLAREPANWDYAELAARAELIAVGTLVSSERLKYDFDSDVAEPFRSILRIPDFGARLRAILVAETTTFRVEVVLKGKLKTQTVRVFHYSFSEPQDFIEPGPVFFKEGLDEETAEGREAKASKMTREYLLFLKRRDDGLFDPVTGQYDAGFSVRQVRNLAWERM